MEIMEEKRIPKDGQRCEGMGGGKIEEVNQKKSKMER